jgi:menaquinone-dependent protoporphyrinogen oxidase
MVRDRAACGIRSPPHRGVADRGMRRAAGTDEHGDELPYGRPMMPTVLIAYATKHDSTHAVAEQIGHVLVDEGLQVVVRPAAEVREVDEFGAVVLGGALYMGRWHKDARHFMRAHRTALAERPTYVFAMGPVDLEEKSVAGARKQLDHALAKTPDVEPAGIAIFGGVIEPEHLRFPFNRMPQADARDPDAIRAWAHGIASELTTTAAANR